MTDDGTVHRTVGVLCIVFGAVIVLYYLALAGEAAEAGMTIHRWQYLGAAGAGLLAIAAGLWMVIGKVWR